MAIGVIMTCTGENSYLLVPVGNQLFCNQIFSKNAPNGSKNLVHKPEWNLFTVEEKVCDFVCVYVLDVLQWIKEDEFLPCARCSRNKLIIQHDTDQDNVVTEE